MKMSFDVLNPDLMVFTDTTVVAIHFCVINFSRQSQTF